MFIFHLYGLFIGIGVLIGSLISSKAQKRLIQFDKEYSHINLENILIWLLIPGVIGARLYHVIDYWQYYGHNLLDIFKIWQGGLGIFGGIFGGLLGVFIYRRCHQDNQPLSYVLDCAAFGLPIAQAIGRLGNFFNQELFGLPTNLPWKMWINPMNRPEEFIDYSFYHPLFAYEAIGNVILLALMWSCLKHKREPGFFLAIYLGGYGLIRFSLDFLRIDPWRVGVLTTAQWISLAMILYASFVMVKKK